MVGHTIDSFAIFAVPRFMFHPMVVRDVVSVCLHVLLFYRLWLAAVFVYCRRTRDFVFEKVSCVFVVRSSYARIMKGGNRLLVPDI